MTVKRDRGYIRRQRKRAIRRKRDILYRIGGQACVDGWARGAEGRFVKGKIHCSCPMCRTKSYDAPSARDRRIAEKAESMIAEQNKGTKGVESWN